MLPSTQIACSPDFGLDAHRQSVRFDNHIELLLVPLALYLPDSNFVNNFGIR